MPFAVKASIGISQVCASVDADLACEDALIVLVILPEELRRIQFIRAVLCAEAAVDAVLDLLHLVLPFL